VYEVPGLDVESARELASSYLEMAAAQGHERAREQLVRLLR
jgi:hypothetical protein